MEPLDITVVLQGVVLIWGLICLDIHNLKMRVYNDNDQSQNMGARNFTYTLLLVHVTFYVTKDHQLRQIQNS